MDQKVFEAELAEAGYGQVETKVLDPKPANVEHAHDHDIRGLVLDGVFTVWSNNQPVSYHSGEVFAVASGIKHSEEIGAQGARVVVGRRWKTPKAG